MNTTPTPDQDSLSGPHGDELTLARLLQERALRTAAVSAEPVLLHRVVTWCLSWDQVVATDDSLDGILVYSRADQLDQDGMGALERRGAAALVVTAGETAGSTFRASTTVPVITVGDGVGYRELSRLVAELTLARETHVLRYGLMVHRSLAELLYRGAGLVALCHQLARLSHSTVAILDQQRRVLAFEQRADMALPREAVAEVLRTRLPEITAEAAHAPHGSLLCAVTLGETALTCVVGPIVLGGRHDGWVVVIESTDTPHPHDLAEHRVVVEQAVTIVGTEMLRMRSVEEAEERARGDFVHALLHGRFASQHDLDARAAHYDFPTDASYGVIVATVLDPVAASESLTTLFHVARDVTRLRTRKDVHTLATVVGDVLAVIRQVDAAAGHSSVDAANRALGEYAATLEHELERRLQRRVAVGYGRPVATAWGIFDSYREARMAVALRQRLGPQTASGFHDLRVFAMLAELATSEQGRSFASDLLSPLRANRTDGGDLEKAVLAYIESGGNVNGAARQLHIHRNTMLYKLDRASRALRLDLRQAEHQFSVWLAHKLDLLAATAAAVDRDVRPT